MLPRHTCTSIGLAVALVLVATVSGAKPAPPRTAPTLASRIELAAGEVKATPAEGGGARRLVTGDLLPAGAALEVGPGGRCLVRLSSGTGVFLRDGTRLVLADDGAVLDRGEAWLEVPEVDDGLVSVLAGGTRVTAEKAGLDVAVAGGKVRVVVVRGIAVVESPGGRAEVGAGETATVEGGGAPATKPNDFWEDWTGGMADHGVLPSSAGRASGRIYAIDRARPGSRPQPLQVRRQDVRAWVRDGIARTEVTQAFFNPSGTPVEGWYWFTLPEGAAVTRFALEVDGRLVEGEVVERRQAAAAYEAAIARAIDPALLEWVDGRTYRARIHPVPAAGERTVVLGYSEILPRIAGVTRYVYPLGDGEGARVQEFSLGVDVGSEEVEVATVRGARIETDKGHKRVTMRRSGFTPRGDFLLEMRDARPASPLQVLRFASPRGEADYLMARWVPEADWDAVPVPEAAIVVVVDTSAGGDDGDRKQKNDAVEAVLRALSANDRFALVAADIAPRLLFPAVQGLAEATSANVDAAIERLSETASAGATDLGSTFGLALTLVHGAPQPAVVYVGDGIPTVGEMRAVELTERLKRSLSGSRARLFTVGVGARANLSLLGRLAEVGGGAGLRIDLPDQTVQRAIEVVGAVKTATITDISIDLGAGLDQVFASGSGKVMRGQEVRLFARTHHPLPRTVKVSGVLAGRRFERVHEVEALSGPANAWVAPLWAREYLVNLLGTGAEESRGQVIALGLEYSLMTPYTSFLVLEDRAAQAVARDRAADAAEREETERDMPAPVMARQPPAPASAPMEEKVAFGSHGGLGTASVPGGGGRSEARGAARRTDHSSRPPAGDPMTDDAWFGEGGDDDRQSVPPQKADFATGRGVLLPELVIGPDRPLVPVGVCSDAAGRPLPVRRDLWARRIAVAGGLDGALAVYRGAVAACEVDGWGAERVLLGLVLDTVRGPADVDRVVGAFRGRPKVADHLRAELIRRVVSEGRVGMPTLINWAGVDAVLGTIADPARRLAELRRVLAFRPSDPEGLRRLLLALVRVGQRDEALIVARRLRDASLGSPEVLAILGDLLAQKGDADAARRAYSEVIENNAWDPAARRRVGDVFLRHGWHEDAYRQYQTLIVLGGDDPASIVRLARAAAGSGRTDEALRVLRKVFDLALEPSASDPREWARLWSAAEVARLMIAARGAADAERAKALSRAMKRTEVFDSPGTVHLLTWDDLDASLGLSLGMPGAAGGQVPADATEADGTGLVAARVAAGTDATPQVSWKAGADRPVAWRVLTVRWDGKEFSVSESAGTASPPVAAVAAAAASRPRGR
ncbi:MAG: VWA domain-containing protein [Deltaproteobacteria bacterium]|nr:VWA domain-containing protein [Deltaproteobacteria bacterium]